MGRKQTVDFDALLASGDFSSVGEKYRARLRSMANGICTTSILSRRIWDRVPYILQRDINKHAMLIIHYMTVALSSGDDIKIAGFGRISHTAYAPHSRRVYPWVGFAKKRDFKNPVVKVIRKNSYHFKAYSWLTKEKR